MTIRIRGSVAGRLIAALAIAASCVSCASSKGGAPTVICGKTVSRNPAGLVAWDATSHDVTVPGVSVGDVVLLRVASGCHTGATLAIEPGNAATIVDYVRASDGRYTAVVLQPDGGSFTVRVTHSSTSESVATVQIAAAETLSSTTQP